MTAACALHASCYPHSQPFTQAQALCASQAVAASVSCLCQIQTQESSLGRTCSRPPLLPCGERERASRDGEFIGLLLHIFAIHHTRESHIIAVARQREKPSGPFVGVPQRAHRWACGRREELARLGEREREKQGLRLVYCSQVV